MPPARNFEAAPLAVRPLPHHRMTGRSLRSSLLRWPSCASGMLRALSSEPVANCSTVRTSTTCACRALISWVAASVERLTRLPRSRSIGQSNSAPLTQASASSRRLIRSRKNGTREIRGKGGKLIIECVPMSTHRLVVLRHGQSQWNLENRFTGWTDVDLTEQGQAEARAAARQLREHGFAFD